MFDSLKEKLGSFRDDVEETAEENAEPVDGEDVEEGEFPETEPGAEVPDDEVATADTSTGPDTGPEPDASGAQSGSDSGTGSEPETEPGAEVPDDEVATADTSTGPDTGPEPDASGAQSGSDSGTGSEPESAPTPGAGEPAPAADTEPDDEGATAAAEPGTAAEEPDPEGDAAPSIDPDVAGEEELDEPARDDDEDEESVGFGRKARSLVRGKFVIEEEDIEEPLEDLELALLSSDVEMGVAEEILENIHKELVGETRRFRESTGEVVEEALREAIYDVISVGQFDFERRIAEADKPLVIVFTGVNGVGKTTSIAKMSRYLEERGFSSVLANGDTYRAGANEQIREHAEALDRKLIAHDQGGDPAAVLYDAVEYAEANGVDVVLGDTAGRLHTDEDLMAQLEKIDRVVGPDMALFVDEAVAGQDAVNRAREFDAAAPFDGAVLTKADADSNGGAAISIAHVTGNPVLFLGTGQGYEDLERFDPDRMVDRLLEED